MIFQQDRVIIRAPNTTEQTLKGHKIIVFHWLPYNPDLNVRRIF